MDDVFDDPRIHSFGVTLEALGRLQRVLDGTIKELSGLAMSEFEALLRLARSGGQLPMGDLADQLTLTSGGATRLVDRLVKAGYVERQPCASDRRILYAAISAEGRKKLTEAIGPHLEDLAREFTERMTPEELEVVTRVMDRLRQPCEVAIAQAATA